MSRNIILRGLRRVLAVLLSTSAVVSAPNVARRTPSAGAWAVLFLALAILQPETSLAAPFNEGFTAQPGGLAAPATSFSMTLGGQSFTLQVNNGDMAWDNTSYAANPALNLNSTGPTTFTLRRTDGAAFRITSLKLDLLPGPSAVVTGRLGGSQVGSPQTATGGTISTVTLNAAVDIIEITSSEFVFALIDDIIGDSNVPPTVTAISPAVGATAGGTTVVITGTGFSTASATGAVRFGATNAIYTINSNTQITATAPAGTLGTVDVRVTTPDGTSVTSAADQYTYIAAPTVTAISPTAGSTGGGTSVVITGTGFAAANPTGAVRFGATNATYTVNSNTQITATAPAGSPGTVDVTVTTPGGTSATSAADQFTYIAAPTVTALSPTSGSTAGGTSVVITGTNFATTSAVSFGGNAATGFTVNSATQITATTPAHAAGLVNVVVTAVGGTGTLTNGYTYVSAPPVANPVSATVAHGSNNNPISLNITGGAATSVAIATAASHGTITASGTTITYTPTAGYAGPDNFTYTATNAGGTSAPATVTITVSSPTITYAPANPPAATVGTAYSQSLAGASGGAVPYTYVTASGALPAGLTLASNGTLSGTPTAGGTFYFVVNAIDSSTGTGPFGASSSLLSLEVYAPTITISPVSLPNATAAVAYSQAITASGGTGPYSFSIQAGTLPPGISMSSSGAFSGTPTATGTYNFTVRATDSSTGTGPFNGSRAYSMTIAAPAIVVAPVTLPNVRAGTAYSQTVTASGGMAPYSFAVTAGALPPGMTLSSSGVLSGTPTASDSYSFTITATDSGAGGPYTGSRAYSLDVLPPNFTLTAPTLSATVGAAYSGSFVAGGGTPAYTYSYVAGTLPLGLTLSSSGTLSGTPTASGTYNFTVIARDSTGGPGAPFQVGSGYSFTVSVPTLNIAPATVPNAQFGTAYSQAISASGGTAPYAYSISSGALPPGLSLSPGGVLSGTPTAPGTFNFIVGATDSSTGSGAPFAVNRFYTVQVTVPGGAVSITTAALPAATGGAAYSQTLAVSGGAAPYVFDISAGALPAGLTLSTAGVLSGTPTATGTFNFTARVTDAANQQDSRNYTLAVNAPTVVVAPASLANGQVGSVYAQTLGASGGAAPYAYAVTAGALPTGVTLSASGVFSGTPTTTGTFNFTVTGTDTFGFAGSQAYSVQVNPPALVAASVNAAVGYGAAATPVALSITGTPDSVAVVSAPLHGTAVASGTGITYMPAAGYAGPDSFTYTASDAYTTTAPATVSVTVSAPTVVLDTTTLAGGTAGSAYTQSLNASGGAAPYGYAVTAGTLPAGLSLSAVGVLSGTPSEAGSFNVTVTVTDSSTGLGPFTASRSYALTVNAPTIQLGPSALPAAIGHSDYTPTLSASGGAAPYRFTVSAGQLPPGVVLAESGVVSGKPTAAGSYAFTVQATDANGFTGTRAFTVTVQAVAQQIVDFSATPTAPVYVQGGTFVVAATGGASGNPVVFASTTSGVCQVTGNTVTMLAAGTCTLTADQAGDAAYAAAPQVRLDVAIAAATPVLTWLEDRVMVQGEADFDLPDPQSNSAGGFTFTSSNPQVATVSGRTVHVVGEGTTVLTATQAASGSYTAATVEAQLVVASRPDPTTDRQVSGGLQAQVDASVRFAQVQQANIRDRLRQVRSGQNPSSSNLTLAYAGSESLPGLSLPVGRAAETAMPALPQGWGVWLAGTATFGQAGRNGSSGGAFDFNTGGITLGADRAVGEHVLLGMAASWGRQGTDFDGTPSQVDADQQSLAFYGLWRAGEHLFVDGLLATGRLDFDLTRWSEVADASAHARRKGDQWFGSLTFGYEHRNVQGMSLTGYGRYDAHRSDLDGYREQGLGIYDLSYGEQRVDNSALAVGLQGEHAFKGERSQWRPFWSIEYRQALENQGDASINYVQRPLGSDYALAMRSYNDDMLALGAGVDLQLDTGWMFSLLLGHEQGRNATRSNSIGLQVRYGSQPSAPAVYLRDDNLGYEDGPHRCRERSCAARGVQP